MLDELRRVLASDIEEPVQSLRSSSGRLAHYTSADAGLSIIRSKSMYMRNATCMNDIAEVHHGVEAIKRELGNEYARERFWAVLDAAHPGLPQELDEIFSGWLDDATTETYITCLSEHLDDEDAFGRLSMWRGYNGGPSVALIVRSDAVTSESDALNAYSYPVIYKTEAEISAMFREKVDFFHTNRDAISSIDRNDLKNHIAWMFDAFTYCLKHPAFREEREWRVVYRPNKHPSNVLQEDVVPIRGIPQPIYRIPLEKIGDPVELDLSPASLIDRVIIGPTDAGWVQYRAFVSALSEAGVPNAKERVHLSGVPYRSRVQ